MNLNNLRTFTKVVEHGSFTQAAVALRCPKSRVSRRLSALETELGVQLLFRTTRKFQLTEAGRRLYQEAQGHLVELERAVAHATNAASEVSGFLRITAPSDIGQTLLYPVVHEYMTLYPRVRIDLNLTNEVVDLVATGTDVGLRLGSLKDSGMRARRLGRVSLSVLAGTSYLERWGSPKTVEELANRDCISFRTGREDVVWRLKSGSRSRSIKLRPTFFCGSADVLVAMVIRGSGICLLPDPYCRRDIAAGRLVPILPEWRAASVPLQIVYSATQAPPAKVRNFVDLVWRRLRPQLN